MEIDLEYASYQTGGGCMVYGLNNNKSQCVSISDECLVIFSKTHEHMWGTDDGFENFLEYTLAEYDFVENDIAKLKQTCEEYDFDFHEILMILAKEELL